MTREEIIKQAANEYMDNYVPDICGMCGEDIWDAFIAGAEWANKYPDLYQVWHDPSEEPQGDEWHIAYLNEVCEIRSLKQKSLTFYGFPTLRSFAKGAGMLCWAYIDDLLPKGGEK